MPKWRAKGRPGVGGVASAMLCWNALSYPPSPLAICLLHSPRYSKFSIPLHYSDTSLVPLVLMLSASTVCPPRKSPKYFLICCRKLLSLKSSGLQVLWLSLQKSKSLAPNTWTRYHGSVFLVMIALNYSLILYHLT